MLILIIKMIILTISIIILTNLKTGGAQRVVAGARGEVRVGAVLQQQPRRLHAVLLDRVVQRRLVLHVQSVHLQGNTQISIKKTSI